MTFVAGLILGVAVYHLLPYSLTTISGDHAVETAVWWMMLGRSGDGSDATLFPLSPA